MRSRFTTQANMTLYSQAVPNWEDYDWLSVTPMKIKLAKLDIDSKLKPERTTIGHIVAEVKKGGELQQESDVVVR